MQKKTQSRLYVLCVFRGQKLQLYPANAIRVV
jgi:hypothetical protein